MVLIKKYIRNYTYKPICNRKLLASNCKWLPKFPLVFEIYSSYSRFSAISSDISSAYCCLIDYALKHIKYKHKYINLTLISFCLGTDDI